MVTTGTLDGQQQAFLYHPGRPVPLAYPQATMQQNKPPRTEESLHIWEQPLPQEPATGLQAEAMDQVYQNQGSVGTTSSHGTMTGPVAPSDSDMQSQCGTWAGMKRYYDPQTGWKEVANSWSA